MSACHCQTRTLALPCRSAHRPATHRMSAFARATSEVYRSTQPPHAERTGIGTFFCWRHRRFLRPPFTRAPRNWEARAYTAPGLSTPTWSTDACARLMNALLENRGDEPKLAAGALVLRESTCQRVPWQGHRAAMRWLWCVVWWWQQTAAYLASHGSDGVARRRVASLVARMCVG